VPKSTPVTDKSLLARIKALASQSHRVVVTRRAQQGMVARSLTRTGVCAVICDYVEGGEPVDETITDTAAGHEGKSAYQLYPTIEAEDLFVKVGIDESTGTPTLILISVHKRH
jgi:hypothetical protein